MERVNFNERLPILEVSGGCIVSKRGDLTMGLELGKPEIFTLGEKEYGIGHEAFVKALKVLPAGMVVHLQDRYWLERWNFVAKPGRSFLARASDRFFEGRPFLRHSCHVYLTRRPAGRGTVDSAGSGLLKRWLVPADTLDERVQRELVDSVGQFSRILRDSGLLEVRKLVTEELTGTLEKAGLIEQYCYLLDGEKPLLRDVDFLDGLRVGNRECVLYTIADADHLPGQCSPSVPYERFSSEKAPLAIGFMAKLGLLLPCDHIVNQYIVIGDGPGTLKKMERKRLRMQSLSKYSRSNAVVMDAANSFLVEAMTEQRLPVRVHVNVLAWTDRREEVRELRSRVVAAFSSMDMVAHEETLGAPQLWWSGIPGNAGDLPDNECFDTFLEQACCLLTMESNYRDSDGSFGIRLGDRLTGKPVHVDIDDEPRRRGWTQNGNLFVLSGSGGGKSFLMNHLCRSYLDQGMHIVIVDVGHSYKGLCTMTGGYYFTYDEKKPMQFNPFFIGKDEVFDTEKKESLKSLLLALWKRSDEVYYRSEYVALSNALQAYYDELRVRPEVFACFNSFYEFVQREYSEQLRQEGVKVKEFDVDNFMYVLRPYYRGGEFDYLLNATTRMDLLYEKLIVFELDNIKDHPILFPVVTLVIMEVFLSKMRKLRGVRKMIVIEEAWKAIANAGMAENIQYWVKTLRKFMGKLALVSQEVEDIVNSPIIKQAIINNSDCRILLDQSKFANKFGEIQALLGITEKQKAEILSINKAHDPGRPYKDLWIGLGPAESHVYRLEVSPEEYLVYTSDQGDKVKIEEYVRRYGSYQRAIEVLASQMRNGNFE